MALLHDAEIKPTKLELLRGWMPSQSWYGGDPAAGLERVGAFRFDDPQGEVGVETFLVRAGDTPTQQVPLTYRAEPFAAGEPWLIGTMEHSVLGLRWVYDACGDPVYAATLAGAILSGSTQAQEYVEVDGELKARPALADVKGSGGGGGEAAIDPIEELTVETTGGLTILTAGQYVLNVVRTPGASELPSNVETLSGTWPGQTHPVLLAFAASD
ncbi:hypothetical protein [Aeromicrobium sp.]|uniref:CG0192-related protein n=1 Tax=Aeromicrobium sp. TaxID=1871063 RepID=UPI0030C39C37